MVFGKSGLVNYVKALSDTSGVATETGNNISNLTSVINLNANEWTNMFNVLQETAGTTSQEFQELFSIMQKDSNTINYFKQIQSQGTQARATVDGLTTSVTQSLIGNARGYEGVSKAISAYNSSLAKTDGSQAAITNAIMQSNSSLGKYITNLNGAQGSIKGYISSLARMKATAIGVNIAFSALNAGLIAIASWAIGKGLNALDNWIHKEEKLAEAAKEAEEKAKALGEEGYNNIKIYNDKSKALKELESRYINLVSSTNDITTIKGDLSSIQDELIDKYGKEADEIDIVNGKLSKNLDLMLELKKEENKQWLRDNNDQINGAKEYLTRRTLATFNVNIRDTDTAMEEIEEREREAQKYYDYMANYIEKNNLSEYINSVYSIRDGIARRSFELKDNLSYDEYLKATKAFLEAYAKMVDEFNDSSNYFDLSGPRFSNLNDIYSHIEHFAEVLNQVNEIEKENIDIEKAVGSDQYEQYKELIDQAQTLSQKLNDPNASGAAMFDYSYQLEETKQQLRNLIDEYPVLENQAELTFKNMGLSIDEVVTDEEEIFNKFFDKLEDTHKTAFSNIEKFEDAMAKSIAGETLTHDEMWGILEFDKDRDMLPSFDRNAHTYTAKYEEVIAVKDKYIKQMKTEIELEKEAAVQNKKNVDIRLESAKGELQNLRDNTNNGLYDANAKENWTKMQELESQIKSLTTSSKAYGREITYNDLLIQSYDSHMGNLASTSRMLQARIDGLKKSQEKLKEDVENLNNTADNLLKAQEYKLDQIISKHEDEKEILDDELNSLNDQLDALEKQKDELDEIIDNYKQVADVVSDAVDKEKELLEEQRKSQEDAYNERINALKEAHEQQEEENELTEKQIALQEKLQVLENAKQNKVMTYSSERGWHYDVDKEELLAAQKEADNAQKDIDDTLAERAYEAEIKALEDERDSILENYDLQIEAYENYVKEWKEILEEQTNAENERLAQEILGSDWREKIKEKDALILNNYKSEFRNYNSQLSSLVNGEMANLKKSIEAKNEEIKAKQELIDQWKNYKSEVQKAVNDIKNANEDYMQYLDGIVLDENSNLEEREANLANFTANYKSYMDEIIAKNNELATATNQMNELANAMENVGSVDFGGFVSGVQGFADSIKDALESAISELMSPGTGLLGSINLGVGVPRFANGGVNDSTGLAMLHGTKSRPELVLNNTDAAKLYNILHDSSFTDMMMEKQYGHLLRNNPITNHNSTNNTSNTINIGRMDINTPDPLSFHDQFQKELKQHYRFALSESKVM